MKIVVDLRCLNEPFYTGVASYTLKMLRQIDQDDLEPGADWLAFSSGQLEKPLELPRPMARRHLKQSNTLLNLKIISGLVGADKLWGSADILWQPNPMFTPRFPGRHLVTIHDLSWCYFPNFFDWHTRLWYLRWVNNWLRQARPEVKLLAVSEYTKQDVLKFFPQWKERIVVQPQVPPRVQPLRETKNSGPRLILFVGTLEPRKNIESLVQAFALFKQANPDYKLILIGQPTSWWKKVKKNLPHCFEERGYVDNQERDRLYQQAWCLVYPSWLEGYGLPPLEAMAYGVPTITSAVPGITEAVGAATILIDPYRGVEEINQALVSLANDDRYWLELSKRGRERVVKLNDDFNLQPLRSIWPN